MMTNTCGFPQSVATAGWSLNFRGSPLHTAAVWGLRYHLVQYSIPHYRKPGGNHSLGDPVSKTILLCPPCHSCIGKLVLFGRFWFWLVNFVPPFPRGPSRVPPKVQDNGQDEHNPHDSLLCSTLAQLQREHGIDGNAGAQARMQPKSGEGNTTSGLRHHRRAWLGAHAATAKAASKVAKRVYPTKARTDACHPHYFRPK